MASTVSDLRKAMHLPAIRLDSISERDWMIADLVIVHHKSVALVAADFGITYSRCVAVLKEVYTATMEAE